MLITLVRDSLVQCFCHSCRVPHLPAPGSKKFFRALNFCAPPYMFDTSVVCVIILLNDNVQVPLNFLLLPMRHNLIVIKSVSMEQKEKRYTQDDSSWTICVSIFKSSSHPGNFFVCTSKIYFLWHRQSENFLWSSTLMRCWKIES